jgi:glycosyltransferase involved in cell wall biosynthesis
MKKPMHVLQVSKSTGGVGQYLRTLVTHLDKDRFRVTAVCLSEGGDELAAELSNIDGVQAYSLRMNRFKIDLFSDAQVLFKLARMIRKEKFDLIHAHTSKPGFLARVAAMGTGVPSIYRPACFSFHDGLPKWKAYFYAAIERVAARWLTAKILVVCEDERILARQYHVGSDSQFVTIHTGIDLSRFEEQADRRMIRASLGVPYSEFLIGTVGRLSKQKAPFDLVNAAAQVHKIYPNVHFVWVGDGELMSETQNLVESLHLEEVFHFAKHRKDVSSVLKSMDCFVLASHWEGFSLSVLEAMAVGLPVVISRVSGAAEAVLDGITGYVAPIGEPQALALALGNLISNPHVAKSFGEIGRQRFQQKFTVERMIKEIEQLYENVVSDTPVSR